VTRFKIIIIIIIIIIIGDDDNGGDEIRSRGSLFALVVVRACGIRLTDLDAEYEYTCTYYNDYNNNTVGRARLACIDWNRLGNLRRSYECHVRHPRPI